MVEKALLEHLLVQTGAVEARREAELDVTPEVLVARGGHHPVGVVALVEDEPLEERGSVELHRAAVDGDAPQAGVAAGRVDGRALAVHQLEGQVVEVRIGWGPWTPPAIGDE